LSRNLAQDDKCRERGWSRDPSTSLRFAQDDKKGGELLAEDAVRCEPFSLLTGIFTGKVPHPSGVPGASFARSAVHLAVCPQFLERSRSTGREFYSEHQGSVTHSSGSLEFLCSDIESGVAAPQVGLFASYVAPPLVGIRQHEQVQACEQEQGKNGHC
jgi:hypothetical protein